MTELRQPEKFDELRAFYRVLARKYKLEILYCIGEGINMQADILKVLEEDSKKRESLRSNFVDTHLDPLHQLNLIDDPRKNRGGPYSLYHKGEEEVIRLRSYLSRAQEHAVKNDEKVKTFFLKMEEKKPRFKDMPDIEAGFVNTICATMKFGLWKVCIDGKWIAYDFYSQLFQELVVSEHRDDNPFSPTSVYFLVDALVHVSDQIIQTPEGYRWMFKGAPDSPSLLSLIERYLIQSYSANDQWSIKKLVYELLETIYHHDATHFRILFDLSIKLVRALDGDYQEWYNGLIIFMNTLMNNYSPEEYQAILDDVLTLFQDDCKLHAKIARGLMETTFF